MRTKIGAKHCGISVFGSKWSGQRPQHFWEKTMSPVRLLPNYKKSPPEKNGFDVIGLKHLTQVDFVESLRTGIIDGEHVRALAPDDIAIEPLICP